MLAYILILEGPYIWIKRAKDSLFDYYKCKLVFPLCHLPSLWARLKYKRIFSGDGLAQWIEWIWRNCVSHQKTFSQRAYGTDLTNESRFYRHPLTHGSNHTLIQDTWLYYFHAIQKIKLITSFLSVWERNSFCPNLSWRTCILGKYANIVRGTRE